MAMDDREFYGALGEKIRYYRKRRGMTQQELAEQINRTLACVSKYEHGGVAIDAYTLYMIARALEVEPKIFLPDRSAGDTAIHFSSEALPALFRHRRLWGYNYKNHKTLSISCLEVDPDTFRATFYIDYADVKRPNSYKYVMPGAIQSEGTTVKVYCINPVLPGDFMLLLFTHVDLTLGRNVGLCASLTMSYRYRAMKFYLSPTPVQDREFLDQVLMFTKEDLTYARKYRSMVF